MNIPHPPSNKLIPTMKKPLMLTAIFTLALGAHSLAEPVPPPFEKPSEAQADDPFDPDEAAPKLIQVQVEFIDLPHKALTKLLLEAGATAANGTALRMKVQEMVDKDQAAVLETQLAVTKSTLKATTESIHEFIYPTEYEPQYTPPPGDSNGKNTAQLNAFPSNPATPTAFSTRNLGSTLEIEPTVSEDGKIIDLRVFPELVWHTGDTIWAEFKDALGNVSQSKMPDIYTMRFNSQVTCADGKYLMIAVQSPKDAKGVVDFTRKVMVFVKCDVIPVK